MSNYVKSTNFAIKDNLVTTDPAKVIKGTEIDNECNAIANAISSKADTNSPALTGTPTAPTAGPGTNTTQLATTSFVTTALSLLYPVGSVYINAAVSTNPATLLGFGTWTEFGAGKVMVGLDSADALFDTLEETGGSKNATLVSHTHTATSVVTDPTHSHNTYGAYGGGGNPGGSLNINNPGGQNQSVTSSSTGITVATTNSTEGSSAANANVQPFIVVKMWKRTA